VEDKREPADHSLRRRSYRAYLAFGRGRRLAVCLRLEKRATEAIQLSCENPCSEQPLPWRCSPAERVGEPVKDEIAVSSSRRGRWGNRHS